MDEICKYCQINNSNHSFFLKYTYNYINYFQSNVSESLLFDDPESIIYHMEIELNNKNYKNQKWNWIINFKDCELKHFLCFNTVRLISKWISNNRFNLQNIYVKKSNYFVNILILFSKLYIPSHINIFNLN